MYRVSYSVFTMHSTWIVQFLFEFCEPTFNDLARPKKFVANIWPSTTRRQALNFKHLPRSLEDPLPLFHSSHLFPLPFTLLACWRTRWHVCFSLFSAFHSNAFIYFTSLLDNHRISLAFSVKINAISIVHTISAMCVCFQLQNINMKIAFIERRKARKFDFAEFAMNRK